MTEVLHADLHRPDHRALLIHLLDAYARDPMGGGKPLADSVKRKLPRALMMRSDALSLFAFHDGKAVGLLNAFEGFSTFAAAPLLNVHDVYVTPEARKLGVASALFEALTLEAQARGCCKITLEVLAHNDAACACYRALGFKAYELDPDVGAAQFWEKPLT